MIRKHLFKASLCIVVLVLFLGLIERLLPEAMSRHYLKIQESSKIEISVTYEKDNADRKPYVAVSGIEKEISLKLYFITRVGRRSYFTAHGSFLNKNGKIDTRIDDVSHGTYRGIYPDGLFWSRSYKKRDYSLARKFSSLPLRIPVLIAEDENGNVAALKRVEFDPLPAVLRKSFSVGSQTFDYLLPDENQISGEPIVFISGSSSNGMWSEARYYARLGRPVMVIRPIPHLSKLCLNNLDTAFIEPAITKFLAEINLSVNRVTIVGFSVGGTAAMLFQPSKDFIAVKRIAISPTTFHFNGASGPACLLPGKYWKAHPKYQTFYRENLAGLIDFLKFKAGKFDQRDVIMRTLSSISESEKDSIELFSKLTSDLDVFWGSDDDQVPAKEMHQRLCSEEKANSGKCKLFLGASHSLIYLPLYSSCYPHKLEFADNCTATRDAQIEIKNAILN